MAIRKNLKTAKKGRKSKKEFVADRTKVLCELYRQYAEKSSLTESKVEFEYQDIEKLLETDRRTTKRICRDVSAFCSLVDLYERGIQVNESTFFRSNLSRNCEAKYAIGRKLCTCLRPLSINAMALGPGSNVAIGAQVMAEEGVLPRVLVTNSLGSYDALRAYRTSEIILTGGHYNFDIHALVGRDAVTSFSNARCEASVMGLSAINKEGELLVKYYDETEVLKQMLRSTSEHVFIVATIEKFISRDTFPVIKISELLEECSNLEVNIITNSYKNLRDASKESRAKDVVAALTRIGDAGRVNIVWADES